MRDKVRRGVEKLTAWRRGILALGLVLMGVAPFLVWEEGHGYGYLGGEHWSYGVPVRESARGLAHPAGLLFALLFAGVLAARRLLREKPPRAREGACIALAALAWAVALLGVGSTDYTPGGVEMSVIRGEGATMAAWGAFLVLVACGLAFRAAGRETEAPPPAAAAP